MRDSLNCDGDPDRTRPVFIGGVDEKGKPRVQVTQCPSAILRKHPEALVALNWVLSTCAWDGMSGSPCGPPEWRRGRTYLDTPLREVQIADLIRSEWGYRRRPEPEPTPKPKTPPPAQYVRRRR